MNKRIQELMKQSMVEHQFDMRFSPEKFAELIVRECADKAYKTAWDDLVHGHGQAVIPLHLYNTIKEHFGVEE